VNREGVDPKLDEEEESERKEKERQARAALWADFQTSVSSSSKTPETTAPTLPSPKLVKVEKRHRFAGEDVVEVVAVPEDSQDAKKWPRWHSHADDDSNSAPNQGPSEPLPPVASSSRFDTPAASIQSSSANATGSATVNTTTNSTTTPKAKPKPGPRKSKTVLPGLPSGKPKKLTTLEKSAMDWRSHLGGQDGGAVDELERNRRAGGGGYLEKVEFMERVEGRREEIFDREKGSKRRKV